MKIVSSGRGLYSQEFYKKKKKRRKILFIFVFIGIILLFSLCVYISRYKKFQINEVAVLGENIIDREEMVLTTEQLLKGKYLWIFPKSNAFIYPRIAIREALLEKFPRLKSVALHLNGLDKLSITIEERIPFALYCADDLTCYLLDNDGFIFDQALSFSRNLFFIYQTGDIIENPLGNRFLTSAEFKSLSIFIKNLATLNVYPVSFKVEGDKYVLSLSNDGKILWRKESDLALIRSNLEAFLSSSSIRSEKNFLDRIEYLDLTIENKVFYK